MPNIFSLFKPKEAVIANRTPPDRGTGKGGIASGVVASKKPQDPIASLSLERIDGTFRREFNNGIFTNCAYTLDQLTQIVAPLCQMVSFWQSKISTLSWEIKTLKDADPKRAERQKEIVAKRFHDFKTLPRAIKHLALHRFYGFSAVKIFPDSLAIISPWTIARDSIWQGSTPPSMDYFLNPNGVYSPDYKTLERIVPPDFCLVEAEQSLLIALTRLAFEWRTLSDQWNRNLESAGKTQLVLQSAPMSSLTEEQRTKLENMLLALSEGSSGWLEMQDSDHPVKIDRIEPPPALQYYKDRLGEIQNSITSLVTASLLSNTTGATGLGSNVATAHQDSLAGLVSQDAQIISSALDASLTIPTLVNAGEIDPMETPLVFFEISERKSNDAKGALELASMARQAGRDIEDAQLSEMTGLSLVPYAPASAIPQAPADPLKTFSNSEPVEPKSPSAFMSKEELESIDKNLLKAIESLTSKYLDDESPIDEDWITSLQDAIKALPPDLVEVSDLEAKLAEEMQKASKNAIAKKVSSAVKGE